ncbi:uncharacterized protein LOC121363196 [Pyrgilauda ruficollis]|uniref:uncharacterized protein LOC121363196 n=1 Tax=Pyrgilauda ruficollis TaxID=221976 RepID=UPI001B86B34E|nr:uncharacterized protein LOC121363196 [Pyrgilauda ruficollis]
MGEVGWIVLFVMTFISCNAFLDLSSVHQVTGTWMGSTTVPCTYVPSEDFTQQTLSWSLERDSSTSTIFRRDDSGDHILLSKFRGRVSVPKHSPGDASLRIQNLEIPDSGHYSCQIIWRSRDNSLITREVTTIVKVVKGYALQRNVGTTGGHHSTTGQEDSSDVEHAVTDPVPTTRVSRMDAAPVGPFTGTGSPRLAASLLLYGLPAALGGAALGALLAAGLGCWRRRRRKDEPLYEVAFRRTADIALLHPEVEVPAKCLQEETCSSTEKTTMKDRKSPEYENLVTAMESQYETEGI